MATDTPIDLFLSLTPEKVLAAVEAAGLRTNPVCYPLNSFENRVYEVELEDRTRIVGKFYRPGRWTEAQILEEHRFMADLAAAEIPICGILPFPDSSTLKQVDDDIYYCLYPRQGGRAPEELTEAMASRIGMLLGRLHNAGAAGEAPHRVRLCGDTYVREDLEWLLSHDTISAGWTSRYAAAANALADTADDWMRGLPTHRVHGDFHLGNLLLRDDVVHVLDFDDMVVGPAVQDIWLCLPGRDDWTTRLRDALLKAYATFREFDRSSLRLVEPLRGLRMVHYAAWLARRWHDPVFPTTWPHFGTESYWSEETLALEELLRMVRSGVAEEGGAAPPAEPEEELTNADFFFDWDG